jgi:hypothetical protein
MPFNTVFSWFIKKRVHQIDLFRKFPVEVQQEWFENLLENGRLTSFGKEHGFDKIRTVADFKKAVPVRTYEEFKPYIDRLRDGENEVLWPGKVKWFAKSSGTTGDRSKYIPVTKEALEDCHYACGKDLLALYCSQYPEARLYSGKHLVLGGSSKISEIGDDCYTGDLSAIIIQNLPLWVELKRTPARDIALMDNWEEKIERLAQSTIHEDVSILAGVPSWTLVLLKRILEITGKTNIRDVWPNLELFMHGGVSFKPYRAQFEALIQGPGMHYFETYNASEGFFGIQDRLEADDMLLMLDYGIYYEFMPMEELGQEFPKTLELREIELDTNYALIISTNGGLWRYLVGDTIRFTSRNPYRIQVSGRTKLFINAFGEELIIENAEDAMQAACDLTGALVTDYTAGPVYMNANKGGSHEWLIEFEKPPADLVQFTEALDNKLKELNSDYEAKRTANLSLGDPLVQELPSGTFYAWMKSRGKLGGQHKVPRLSNSRDYLDEIKTMVDNGGLVETL